MNKRTRRIIAIVLLAAFALWLIFVVFPFGRRDTRVRQSLPGEKIYEPRFKKEGELAFLNEQGDTLKQIDIELADNEEEREYGMMYRKSMDANTGMLFIMGAEAQQAFWMKNTYIPLDIIFIDNAKKVVSIQRNAQPLSEKNLPSEGPASLVLEVTGGFSDQYNIHKGTQIRYHRDQ